MRLPQRTKSPDAKAQGANVATPDTGTGRVTVASDTVYNFLAGSLAAEPFGGAEIRATVFGTLLNQCRYRVAFETENRNDAWFSSFRGIPVHLIPRNDGRLGRIADEDRPALQRLLDDPRLLLSDVTTRRALARAPLSLASAARKAAWALNQLRHPTARPLMPFHHADVYFCFGPSRFVCSAIANAKRQGASVVFCPTSDGEFKSKNVPLHHQRRMRYCLESADAVILQTQEQRSLLRHGNAMIFVIPNPAPHLALDGGRYPAPTIVDDRHYGLWIGRPTIEKDPAAFLDLARRLPHRRFAMVMSHAAGNDPVARLRPRLPRNVDLYGKMPFSELHQLIARARVFISTSTREGFPNTFVQSLCEGVPVVSFKLNPGSVLTRERVGKVAGNNAEQLSVIVDSFFADDVLHASYAERARDFGSLTYGLAASTKRLQEVVNAVLEDRQR